MFYFVAIFLVFIPVGLLAARWLIAPVAVVAERMGPRGSLKRSWALTRGNLWRCFGFLVLLVIFNFVVIGLPITMLQWLLMFALTTQWYGWLSGLVAGLTYFVNILWYPILVLALTLLYFDLRVRNESLDLDARIRALEQSVGDTAPALPAIMTDAAETQLPTRRQHSQHRLRFRAVEPMVRLHKHLRILLAGIVLFAARVWGGDGRPCPGPGPGAEETGVPLAEYIGALREAQEILADGGEPAAVDQARAVLEGIDRVGCRAAPRLQWRRCWGQRARR